ncbi:PilZ domain-containing protein [Dissulfurirhabdus thermomarina]|uniref:PilZ domain-containing protein n=1 Tax=Dissulfurirhabdus thermomarina TaxID=1765737 RepID=A0A6N9TSZ4_DISTH|nr:PilZ domain-containing protein [Dissulfurirhabdus thermomarina]NDY41656.1 PilZ domain-containing protein [Dissulfurirhabdus thermomarina]NMX24348.1 PilZ domain-containing protein [Dissulfurirhabdus thermomarina]
MAGGIERRRNVRAPFQASAALKAESGGNTVSIEGPTRDLSLKGLYLYSEVQLPVGTPCEVQLRLMGSSTNLSLWIQGKVARVDETGMAIEFERINVDDLAFFRTFLHYRSGEPEVIEREFSAITSVDGFIQD